MTAGASPNSKMYKRLLIVRLSSLGDIALTLPLLFALRMKMTASHIGWVVDEPFAPLLDSLAELDRIHVWKKKDRNPRGIWRLVKEIRAEGYEVSIDPQGLARSALLPFIAHIPMRIGFKHHLLEGRELSPLLISHPVSPPGQLTHISARNLYLGSALGLDMPTRMPVKIPRRRRAGMKLEQWWKDNHLSPRTIVFGIGAGWPTRMWAVEEMAALVEEARDNGYRSVILWGPYEKGRLKAWKAKLGTKVTWAPETDIPEMIALLRLCNRFAGPDSAALHLAWLLGKPTFCWFGASDPERTAPRGIIHAFIAKGPHTWHRKKFTPTGLQTLTGTEALPIFKKWLGRSIS